MGISGALCHWHKKMMGRSADGGCGTEERPCRPISSVSGRSPARKPENALKRLSFDDVGVDFFSQAGKVLSERSPFDIPEGGSISELSVPTLPSGLASLLKQADSRKRHKKLHSGAGKSSKQKERKQGGCIWVETKEYFRDLALQDIDALFKITPSSSLAARKKCFVIPCVGDESRVNLNLDADVREKASVSCGEHLNVRNENDGVGKEEKVVVEEENEQLMEIDSVETQGQFSLKEESGCSVSDSSSGLGWLLGSMSRRLTSERPSKKRKLLGDDDGLKKVLVACQCDGNSSLCHFCCTDDNRKESNRMVVCCSCKVAVHQKCYGVPNDVDSSWLCSWCKQKNDSNDAAKPCALCPKQGGALKPIQKSDENSGSVEFAHLFCSIWMPEFYVEDLTKMETIINVGEIMDTRKKLVCNVCRVKYGACVPCSHGMFVATFSFRSPCFSFSGWCTRITSFYSNLWLFLTPISINICNCKPCSLKCFLSSVMA